MTAKTPDRVPTLQFRYPDNTSPDRCPRCNATGTEPCLSAGNRRHPQRPKARR